MGAHCIAYAMCIDYMHGHLGGIAVSGVQQQTLSLSATRHQCTVSNGLLVEPLWKARQWYAEVGWVHRRPCCHIEYFHPAILKY